MRTKCIAMAAAGVAALAAASPAAAATVALASGERVVGDLVGLEEGRVKLKSPVMGDVSAMPSDISDGELGIVVVQTNSGDIVAGPALVDGTGVKVDSRVGQVAIAWHQIVSLTAARASATGQGAAQSTDPVPSAKMAKAEIRATYSRSGVQENDLFTGRQNTIRETLSIGGSHQISEHGKIDVSMPFTRTIIKNSSGTSKDWGLGDMVIDASRSFSIDKRLSLDIDAIAVLPTGNAEFYDATTAERITSGFWGAGGGASLAYQVGPGSLFASGSVIRFWPRNSSAAAPFTAYEGVVGAVVQLNERWLLSTDWRISHQDGIEPAYLDLGLRARLTERLTAKIMFSKGLGLDAEDGAISLGLSSKF